MPSSEEANSRFKTKQRRSLLGAFFVAKILVTKKGKGNISRPRERGKLVLRKKETKDICFRNNKKLVFFCALKYYIDNIRYSCLSIY